MNRLIEHLPSLIGRIRNLAHAFVAVLASVALAGAWVPLAEAQTSLQQAQTLTVQPLTLTLQSNPNDPNTWPATFPEGDALKYPYGWVDGPTHLQKDPQLLNGVYVGDAGGHLLYVCRAKMPDGGVHPGKFFAGQCLIGYDKQEVVLTSGYELLVNTKPEMARFFTRNWVSPTTDASATFKGGFVGTTPMRVCRASYSNGVHPGKEWGGKCLIGYGGQEVLVDAYEVLSLGFDKAAWQAAGSPLPTTITATALTLTQSFEIYTGKSVDEMMAEFTAANPDLFTKKWSVGYLGAGFSKLAEALPDLLYSMIDK